MEKQGNQSHLPKVEQDDILSLVSEEVSDKNHEKRWDHFTKTNPLLSDEILMRSHTEAKQSAHFDENYIQFQTRIMNTVTFALRAMEVANQRQHGEPLTFLDVEDPTSGDVDGEDQPLSA